MTRKKAQPKPVPPAADSAFERARSGVGYPSEPPPTVPARWLLTAVALALAAAIVCGWGALCFVFWQGSWQLLYHPATAVTRTPASAGLAFEPVGFAADEAGLPRLRGWWLPAGPDARYTVLYLHGQDGSLGDTVECLAVLHGAGVNVLAFDYRGYGQSQFARPSEARWREDAESALTYLTGTRHVAANSIILDGRDLGANLALEMAATHAELAGAILREPLEQPTDVIFRDPRARLVPAHLLVRDRFDANNAASRLNMPSLWLYRTSPAGQIGLPENPDLFQEAPGPKMLFWLTKAPRSETEAEEPLRRWLDDLPNKGNKLPSCQFGGALAC